MKITLLSQARPYITPELTEVRIDKNITLCMMSGNGSGEIPNNPEFNQYENEEKKDKDAFGSPFEQ